MAIPKLALDYKEFLKLLESNHVEYLLIGGYAVGIYGYVRATNDLDVWVRMSVNNAANLERALKDFGFAAAEAATFLVLGQRDQNGRTSHSNQNPYSNLRRGF